jgi:hypothetical protein
MGKYIDIPRQQRDSDEPRRKKSFWKPGVAADAPIGSPAIADEHSAFVRNNPMGNRNNGVATLRVGAFAHRRLQHRSNPGRKKRRIASSAQAPDDHHRVVR